MKKRLAIAAAVITACAYIAADYWSSGYVQDPIFCDGFETGDTGGWNE